MVLFNNSNYVRKLYLGEEINKFDLLYNGNMGYDGSKRYIDDIENICDNSTCLFYVEEIKFYNKTQFNYDIYNYVINNYEKIDSNEYLDIYVNK